MAAGAPLLELEQVNKWFGDLHVLQDVDLRVAAGEGGGGRRPVRFRENQFFADPRTERAKDFLSKIISH